MPPGAPVRCPAVRRFRHSIHAHQASASPPAIPPLAGRQLTIASAPPVSPPRFHAQLPASGIGRFHSVRPHSIIPFRFAVNPFQSSIQSLWPGFWHYRLPPPRHCCRIRLIILQAAARRPALIRATGWPALPIRCVLSAAPGSQQALSLYRYFCQAPANCVYSRRAIFRVLHSPARLSFQRPARFTAIPSLPCSTARAVVVNSLYFPSMLHSAHRSPALRRSTATGVGRRAGASPGRSARAGSAGSVRPGAIARVRRQLLCFVYYGRRCIPALYRTIL